MALCLLPAPCSASPHSLRKGLLHQLLVQPVVGGGSFPGAGLGVHPRVMPRAVQSCMRGAIFGGGVLFVGC